MQICAQTIDIDVNVEDAFLGSPLGGVKVSVLNMDSTVVVDSARNISFQTSGGKPLQEKYIAPVKAKIADYLLRASKPGYGDVWQKVSVLYTQVSAVKVPTIKMRKERNYELGEAVVKATRVKMYYKGDTLVYDAAAFKLPDGSMLDGLIRQLPGVTMNEGGEIFVNGRKVDELLLGSRSFMSGNKKVLMENLPYYTVKDLKVYEKQTARSEALGYDVDPRSYVMDVNLRNEYTNGYIANVEAAGGTEDRWLGRGFLLGFTDCWRYTLLGNANNVNESRHIDEHGHWSPSSMPQSLLTTRSIAADLDYLSKSKNVSNNLNADFTYSGTDSEVRTHYEQFLEGSKPISQTNNHQEADNWHVKVVNSFRIKKPFFFNSNSYFDYDKRNASGTSQFEQWDNGLTASMRTRTLSDGRSWAFTEQTGATFNLNKEKHWYGYLDFLFRHSDDRSQLSNRYDTWQASTQANVVQRNANDVSSKLTNLAFSSVLSFADLFAKLDLMISNNWTYSDSRVFDYLYHPDTLLLASQLDMLMAITDLSNSYDSHYRQWCNKATLTLKKQAAYKMAHLDIGYDRWALNLGVPVFHRSLDYKRGNIDTLARNTRVFLTPGASFRYVSNDHKRDFSANAEFNCEPADMLDKIGYRDDSRPLVVKMGNPDLKGTATTSANIGYKEQFGKKVTQWHLGALLRYNHRAVAQSVSYNPTTGAYTYKPMNVRGAYLAVTRFDISYNIDRNNYWTCQMNADAGYSHSVDHAMMEGEIQSRENAVNSVFLHDKVYIQYNKGVLNVRASGDIRWRHSEGKMRDFEVLNAMDFNYGLSARYTIPRIKMTLSADATMYSRRGYGSPELNTDDLVLNASLSQPLLKGKLIARIEAFDLLRQVSSVQYNVSAQGRTERWFRSLPHYVMLHLVYHWSRNPKKP